MPQTLHNGIELPGSWPPRYSQLTLKAAKPAYLESPPTVIRINIGRQLFVDDFLISHTTLDRTFHTAQYHPASPVLVPDHTWENKGMHFLVSRGKWIQGPSAMPFSDGVWYDPQDQLFKMWYMAGMLYGLCYATSTDGIHWKKPKLDVVPGTNIVHYSNRDSTTVWLDLFEKDPNRRYKLYRFEKKPRRGFVLHYSPDGIHWSDEIARAGEGHDRMTIFYNPFRKVWVHSIKATGRIEGLEDPERMVRYWEQEDLEKSPMWGKMDEALLWTATDELDPIHPDSDIGRPKVYNLDAVAYESILLGGFAILETYYAGKQNDRPKRNQVHLGFSRDGFHWDRPFRKPVIGVSEQADDWNWGNVQTAGGICLINDDKLYIYVSGRAGRRSDHQGGHCDARGTTGLAIMRRDGFASMDAMGKPGTLTTRPVTFNGKHLFVNVNGEVAAEVLDKNGQVIAPFTQAHCRPVTGDTTCQMVQWKSNSDLSQVAGRPVRLRFHLKYGQLYAFWISSNHTGASHGYVAAGGPGFTGPTDTVGQLHSRKT